MHDPLPRNHYNNKGGSFQFHGNNSNYAGAKLAGGTLGKKKSDYCWNFNKGVKCKFGKSFIGIDTWYL